MYSDCRVLWSLRNSALSKCPTFGPAEMSVTRSPTRKDGNNGNTVNTLVNGKESELHRSTECELGNDEAEEGVVKAFNNSIGNILCIKVEHVTTWLSNNPNSRTGLCEFVEWARNYVL